MLAPRSTAEALSAFELVEARGPGTTVTLSGARRSFEAHFVPSDPNGVAISSERLRGATLRLDGDRALARALSGTSFAELLDAARHDGKTYMPRSAPTAEAISLGGALAANTHSRTSDTYGGFFADHVTWFRLVCPGGRTYECHAGAGALERDLFRFVPGSLGALGLVTELELELAATDPAEPVAVHVLENRAGDPLATVAAYADAADRNRDVEGFRWSEGVGAVFFGPPRACRSLLLARKRAQPIAGSRPTLPLFADRPTQNALLQALLHRFSEPAQWLTPRLMRKGRVFQAGYRRWTFFQSSWDDAVERLAVGGLGWRALCALSGVDRSLSLVHQSWVIPRQSLLPFMQLYFDLLGSPRYASLARHFELQDLVPIPHSRWPLAASFRHEHGSHVFTLNCPARELSIRDGARRFCAELTRSAWDAGLGVVVHLVKQLHLDDGLLREMYAAPLAELRELKRRVDPKGMIRSRTLERLGVA